VTPLDLRYLILVLFECVGIDDRRIDAAQVEQRIQILRGTPGDDRQDMQIWPVVDDAGHFRCQPNRRTLKQAAGEAEGPGFIFSFSVVSVGGVAAGGRAAFVHRRRQAEAPEWPARTRRARALGVI
jgi:hypothetical protein